MTGFLSNFRRAERGSVATELSVAIGMLSLGFVGLWTTTNSIRNANAAELAVTDVVMTARAIGDIEERSNIELRSLFETAANETLLSSQHATVSVSRSCGCPTDAVYSQKICTVEACGDGLVPARYLDLVFDIGPSGQKERAASAENTFRINAAVQY